MRNAAVVRKTTSNVVDATPLQRVLYLATRRELPVLVSRSFWRGVVSGLGVSALVFGLGVLAARWA